MANLMSLSFAERAQKVVFCRRCLPQGVHLRTIDYRGTAGIRRRETMRRAGRRYWLSLEQLGITHLALQYLDGFRRSAAVNWVWRNRPVRRPELLLLDGAAQRAG